MTRDAHADDIVAWAERRYYIPETRQPIVLEPFQRALLRLALTKDAGGLFPYRTVVWSSVKKSGKTAIAGLVTRWFAECQTRAGEVYCCGNDAEQARERAYRFAKNSIELTPGFLRTGEGGDLEGRWHTTMRYMHCLTTGSVVKAIPVDAPSEAGANPDLTVWCVPTETPILSANLRWLPAGQLTEGERLVGFDEYRPGYNLSRRFRTATVTAFETKTLPCVEIELDGDAPLRATPEHCWLVRRSGQNVMFWKRTAELQPGDELAQIFEPWEPLQSYDAGYVAGALDGEGHLSPLNGKGSAGGYTLGVAQMPGKGLLEKVEQTLTEAGLPVTYVRERHSSADRLRIDQKQAVVRTLGMYRPMRLLMKFSPDRLGHIRNCGWHRVLSTRDVGLQEMACIATDTKTYIARGYGAHNTELWAMEHRAALRFWEEMTPVPTRFNSTRWVDSYAGFDGESELLRSLYDAGMAGRQMTAGELAERTGEPLGVFEEVPGPDDPVPIWTIEAASLLVYWDTGETARRMPWQRGPIGERYYREAEASDPPKSYARHHLNEWVGAESELVPLALWDACYESDLPPFEPGSKEPCVLGVDAASTGDSFAVVAVTRHPRRPNDPAIRACRKWDPPAGGAIDYAGPEGFIRDLLRLYNVVWIAYDPHQLTDMMQRIRKDLGGAEGEAYIVAFEQGKPRLMADRRFYDLIVQRRLAHHGAADMRGHIQNANAKFQKDQDSTLRIVKKAQGRKVDLVVAASMACDRCLTLLL